MVNLYGISKFHVKLFTDAVFGIAITLLAVELKVPNIDNSDILDISQFQELSTIFVSYITSFVIIGMYWITYHSVFNPIRHTTDLIDMVKPVILTTYSTNTVFSQADRQV